MKRIFINFLFSSLHCSPILMMCSVRSEQASVLAQIVSMSQYNSVWSSGHAFGPPPVSFLKAGTKRRYFLDILSGFSLFFNGRIIFLFACAGSFLGGFAALFLGEHPTSSAVFGKGGSRRIAGLELMTLAAAAHLAHGTCSPARFSSHLSLFSTRPPPSRTKTDVSPAAPRCTPAAGATHMSLGAATASTAPVFQHSASCGTQPDTPQEARACSHRSQTHVVSGFLHCSGVKEMFQGRGEGWPLPNPGPHIPLVIIV